MSSPLSVTVLAGSAGNDGSNAVKQLIQQTSQVRLTAIVPKRKKRQKKSAGPVPILPTTERLVRLGQGCSCCTVRGDLMAKVQRIAAEQSAEHILIHATPHADLRTVAKTFTVKDDNGAVLSDLAHIESFVTVIDARGFCGRLEGSVASALIERLEIANVVLIEGDAGLSESERHRVHSSVRAINAGARLVWSDGDEVRLSSLHVNQPFDLDQAEHRAEDPGVHGAEEEVSEAIVRFEFEARRPFHPTRLHDFLAESWGGVVRAKGTLWVASQPDFACRLNAAGASRTIVPEGSWWATVPEQERPKSSDMKQYLETIWHPDFGDRHQNLNFVGVDVDAEAFMARLEGCLVTDEEFSVGGVMPDPFKWPGVNP